MAMAHDGIDDDGDDVQGRASAGRWRKRTTTTAWNGEEDEDVDEDGTDGTRALTETGVTRDGHEDVDEATST